MVDLQKSENINILCASLIIEELLRHGNDYFCISPGSRSAPLTVAAARNKKAKTKIFFDERSAAFHALGYSRATGIPAILICTSGTAVANYYPAVIEAYMENIPLIILSADRPPELHNIAANQTIDQVEIFGKYCKYFFNLPCPDDIPDASLLLSEIDDAFFCCTYKEDPGPVHINCMFRDPLAPKKVKWDKNFISDINMWITSQNPFRILQESKTAVADADLSYLLRLIKKNAVGIILAGRNENKDHQKAILELAEKINWPVIADITSGIRLNDNYSIIMHHFDQLLLSKKISKEISALPLFHFGGQFVSKRLIKFLEKHTGPHIHINNTIKNIDPAKSVTRKITANIRYIIDELNSQITEKKVPKLISELVLKSTDIRKSIIQFIDSENTLNEISIASAVSQNIKNDSALFLASSMPVRDMDMYGIASDKNILIAANRGASGIDGTISSAFGFCCGSSKALTLIIGDLAFIHDQSSLSSLTKIQFPFIIISINNNGGGIFSFLPIAKHKDVFEKNFATPHNLTFKKCAEMYQLHYNNPASLTELIKIYQNAQNYRGASLIEISINRESNRSIHQHLQKHIKELLK